MTSPRDRLLDALHAWLLHDARERLARARGDEDAAPVAIALERHATLRGPRAREIYEEARERGLLEGADLALSATWLREAHAAPGRARAAARLAEVLAQRVPHDSDHFLPTVLFERMCREPHVGRRRAFARSLEERAPALLGALRDGLADVDEALDTARWLGDAPPPDRADSGALREAASAILRDTGDVWAEVLERLGHAAGTPLETWPDLLFALRAPELDDRVDPRSRYRRIAEPLGALGVGDALSRRARVQGVARDSPRARVIPLDVPRAVRIVPNGLELGLASERAALEALGRAVAIAWTHPALPPLSAWPEAATVGRALGALFAHLPLDPAFAEASERGSREARRLRETHAALELFVLRTAAAALEARSHLHLSSSPFADASREHFRRAWQVDVNPHVASLFAVPREAEPDAALRALRWAAPLHLVLRDRYDEDYWRNPRAAEPLRAAAERGPTLPVEAWTSELDVEPSRLAERYAELVR